MNRIKGKVSGHTRQIKQKIIIKSKVKQKVDKNIGGNPTKIVPP
jgi:hypothetical protein